MANNRKHENGAPSGASVTVPTRSRRNRARPGERGVAMIMVLGVLAVAGLMAAHLSMSSQVVAREAVASALREELKYAAESAAERGFWLLLADRSLFSSRTLGLKPEGREELGVEPWMMDGRIHDLRAMEFPVRVAVYDAEKGVDCSGAEAEAMLRGVLRSDDEQIQERYDRFLDILADYVDADDLVRLRGMERGDYEGLGMADLPRNAPLQFREELYWLIDAAEAAEESETPMSERILDPGTAKLIPPPGVGLQAGPRRQATRAGTSGKPSFFSSSPGLIRELAGLTDVELQDVMAARDAWQRDGAAMEDTLPADLLGRLKSRFSFDESGVATLVASAFSPDGKVSRTVRITRDCRTTGQAFADGAMTYISNWERVFY